MMEAWFDLNGAGLQVLAEDSALLEPLLPYLNELRAEVAQTLHSSWALRAKPISHRLPAQSRSSMASCLRASAASS